jgi:amino acid transporter
VNDKKEAAWFAVVACIAMLVLVILYLSGPIIGAHIGMEETSTPGIYWVLVVVCLGLCALVPYLLKDSRPMDFKIIGILLTAVAPAAIIGFILFSLWRSGSPG